MGGPNERAFAVFPRGHVRDNIILANFRNALRTVLNPASGQLFTEDEITRATAPGTRFYIEADSIDLFGQATQQRAVHFAAQVDPRRATTSMLEGFHGSLWLGEDSRLPATGAGGLARARGTNGTVIPGSITLGDPSAAIATDPNGQRFQNLETSTVVNGQVLITLRAIDGGVSTRLPVDTELRWSQNVNPGTDPTVVTLQDFDGGFDQEDDESYSGRIVERIRERPASGNSAHFQAWAREASSGVEAAFVYPTALRAGSVLVAILEKRARVRGAIPEGPLARVPSATTLNAVADYLVPPSSPVVPEHVFVLVTPVSPQPSDLVLRLSLSTGATGGWADPAPWPTYSPNFPALAIESISVDGLTFTIRTDVALPNGATSLVANQAPALMVWNWETSRFVQLDLASVTDPGVTSGRGFTINLHSLPKLFDSAGHARLLQVGDRISPYTDRARIVATALESYFDQLGPGEVLPASDIRFARARRVPTMSLRNPARAGQSMIGDLIAALGNTAADAELTSISRTDPDLPANLVEGPNMITLGHLAVFPL